jgi:hypothetical protein
MLSAKHIIMAIAKRFRREVKLARSRWNELSQPSILMLLETLRRHHLSIASGDLLLVDGHWYITHAGLLKIAARNEYDIGSALEFGSFLARRNSLLQFARGRRLIPKCRKCHLKIVCDRALFLRCFLLKLAFEFRRYTKV